MRFLINFTTDEYNLKNIFFGSDKMPLFPWRYNNNYWGNPNTQYPYGNQQYNVYGGYNAGGGYTEAFNEVIKRNIEAEQKSVNSDSEINPERKKEILRKIKEFIKNERNSFLFYEYLRGICDNEKFRIILKKVSDDCETAKNIYTKFYKENFEGEILIGKSNVNESVNFVDGVLWAVEVESGSIFNISEFVKDFNITEGRFNRVLFGKSARIGYLNYILLSGYR